MNARLLDEGGTPAQGNQGAARLKCRIACTIFYNDEAAYNTVINRFTAGTGDCISLARNSLWNASANGAQQQKVAEISPIHSVISLIWGSCPNSEQQGTDLFGHWGNRLMWTLEYWAKYNLGNSVPYTTFGPCAQSWSTIGANGRSTTINWALTDMFYEAYVVKKGLSAPYTVQYRNQQTLTVNTWYFRR
ncbi:hypothetical protein [Pedobacter rhodius]|uniref:Uncharacterized protein n=1 Tax=Pedobacter rhodius TaxID=3004098 RepID=A0ABT4L1N2_9SPHI|nr:hypothetical protein [Pedobacter sp. SJ11]MCZ4225087.1 hypothetical protein [Pedobacter sp. SJ11]